MWESRLPSGEISKGLVGSVGNLLLVFHAFHRPGISTALRLYGNRGGTGDSILHWRNNRVLAELIFRAHSVSFICCAC